MIDYRFNGRLTYIPGGALSVNMSAWPAVESGNWWEPTTGSFTCVAAYQAKGAASLAASYVNLANPGTNNAAPGDAPSFDTATGWTFNGSSNYLTTGVVPQVLYSALVRFNNVSVSTAVAFGTTNVSDNQEYGIYVRQSGTDRNYKNAGDGWRGNGALSSGVLGFANKAAYLNGSSDGTINAGTTTWITEITIGCRNVHPFGRDAYMNGNILAVAIYSTTLDATQMAEISDNMADL